MFQACPLWSTRRANPVLRLTSQGAAALVFASAVLAGELRGQAAVDPNVAPRAAALERAGERRMAIGLLGRYLATDAARSTVDKTDAFEAALMRELLAEALTNPDLVQILVPR